MTVGSSVVVGRGVGVRVGVGVGVLVPVGGIGVVAVAVASGVEVGGWGSEESSRVMGR